MRLSKIRRFLGALPQNENEEDIEISGLNSLNNANFTELSYCDGDKNSSKVAMSGAGAVLISKAFIDLVPQDMIAIVVPNPHLSFALLSKLYAKPLIEKNRIEPKIDKSATIMPNVYIGSNVEIGPNCTIMAGCFIGDNVKIGEECNIHPNVVIYNDTIIGKKCHILANAVIGSDGFGYAHSKNGEHYKIYHNGNVVIEDFVEIGAGTTIDRAVFDTTLIKQGTKVDNLVQIGHNCEIGDNCIIVSQTGISGSSILGRNVVMGGQSATSGHIEIGDFAMIAARGGVTKSLDGAKTYGGFPIMLQKDWLKLMAKLVSPFKRS